MANGSARSGLRRYTQKNSSVAGSSIRNHPTRGSSDIPKRSVAKRPYGDAMKGAATSVSATMAKATVRARLNVGSAVKFMAVDSVLGGTCSL